MTDHRLTLITHTMNPALAPEPCEVAFGEPQRLNVMMGWCA